MEETPSDPPPREDGVASVDEDETTGNDAVSLEGDILPVADDDVDREVSSEEELVEGGKEKDCDGREGCNKDDEPS